MGVQAHISSKHKFNEAEIIQFVIDNGVDMIKLINRVNSMNREVAKGFDDVVVEISREGKTRLTFTKYGTATFLPNKFGIREAWVPRTKRNMRVLAAHVRDKRWTVSDATIRAEVQKLSDALPINEKDEQRRINDKLSPIGGHLVDNTVNVEENLKDLEIRNLKEANRKLQSKNMELIEGKPEHLQVNFEENPVEVPELADVPEGAPAAFDGPTLDPPDKDGKPDPTAALETTDDPASEVNPEADNKAAPGLDSKPPAPSNPEEVKLTPYKEMSMFQLQAMCKQENVTMPQSAKKKDLVALLNKVKPIKAAEPAAIIS